MNWQWSPSGASLDVTVPAGSTARLVVPGATTSAIVVNGHRHTVDTAALELTSGTHRVQFETSPSLEAAK